MPCHFQWNTALVLIQFCLVLPPPPPHQPYLKPAVQISFSRSHFQSIPDILYWLPSLMEFLPLRPRSVHCSAQCCHHFSSFLFFSYLQYSIIGFWSVFLNRYKLAIVMCNGYLENKTNSRCIWRNKAKRNYAEWLTNWHTWPRSACSIMINAGVTDM